MKEKMSSLWEVFKKNFPLKDVILGFAIPKVIFFVGLKLGHPFAVGLVGLSWCVAVFYISQVRSRRVNVFAVLAVIMIIARVAVITTKNNPRFYLFVQAADNAVYALIFLGSLFFSRSLIQFFVEAAGAEFSAELRQSPYYKVAWRIVTLAWGIVYALTAVVLVLLRLENMQTAGLVDLLSGWPASMALFVFSIQFPRWYWQKNQAKIAAYKIGGGSV
jgi:intracellular septation protein A